jgi:hypothetical protein
VKESAVSVEFSVVSWGCGGSLLLEFSAVSGLVAVSRVWWDLWLRGCAGLVFGGGCAVGRVLCLADLVWAIVFEGSGGEVSSVDFIVCFFLVFRRLLLCSVAFSASSCSPGWFPASWLEKTVTVWFWLFAVPYPG